MKVLVTGSAGFIGFHLVQRLLERGDEVVGIDNLNDYYDVRLKHARLARTGIDPALIAFGKEVRSTLYPAYRFVACDLADREMLPRLFERERFGCAVNLAAQAGVRYSIENPWAYAESNLMGFVNLLECCRHNGIGHLVYASSSSVYGGNDKTPFSEDDRVDNPESLYAATKRSNELMASCYSKLYGIPATGLRFFTVYGPWGRPDMAPMLFAKAIAENRPIRVFNNGDMLRDFTYIDDIVEGVLRVIDIAPEPNSTGRRHVVYNIGCSHPVRLIDFITTLEEALGRKAEKILTPMQPGDVYQTYADTSKLETVFGYKPRTGLREGIASFVAWLKDTDSTY